MGGFVTPYGRQSVNGGGTHEEGHVPYKRGANFNRLYHKLKVVDDPTLVISTVVALIFQ